VQQETTLRARARTSGVAPLPATRQDYQPTKTAFMDEAESHSTKRWISSMRSLYGLCNMTLKFNFISCPFWELSKQLVMRK
jgi:hypothetical protein